MKKTFAEHVYAIVKKIPKGKTLTYGQVARIAGKPRAYRAVGTILSQNIDNDVPCHRVIRSDGSVGGYNKINGRSKKAILKREGVNV